MGRSIGRANRVPFFFFFFVPLPNGGFGCPRKGRRKKNLVRRPTYRPGGGRRHVLGPDSDSRQLETAGNVASLDMDMDMRDKREQEEREETPRWFSFRGGGTQQYKPDGRCPPTRCVIKFLFFFKCEDSHFFWGG